MVPGVGSAVRRGLGRRLGDGLVGGWVGRVSTAFQARHEDRGTPRLRLKADRLSKAHSSAGGKVPPPTPLPPSRPPVAGSARFCMYFHPGIGGFSVQMYAKPHISWYHNGAEVVDVVVRGAGRALEQGHQIRPKWHRKRTVPFGSPHPRDDRCTVPAAAIVGQFVPGKGVPAPHDHSPPTAGTPGRGTLGIGDIAQIDEPTASRQGNLAGSFQG